MIRPAGTRTAARLRALPLTTPTGVADSVAPAGFREIEEHGILCRRDFDGTVEDLTTWRLHRTCGIDLRPASARAELGTDLLLRVGFGPFHMSAPCRVLEVIDGPDRAGFAYGTLRGHPECGLERFEIVRDAMGTLSLHLTGFSRPGTVLTRCARPVADAVQRRITARYLRALDHL
jgi:uncharacterized protein (UPF0548 family)